MQNIIIILENNISIQISHKHFTIRRSNTSRIQTLQVLEHYLQICSVEVIMRCINLV